MPPFLFWWPPVTGPFYATFIINVFTWMYYIWEKLLFLCTLFLVVNIFKILPSQITPTPLPLSIISVQYLMIAYMRCILAHLPPYLVSPDLVSLIILVPHIGSFRSSWHQDDLVLDILPFISIICLMSRERLLIDWLIDWLIILFKTW